MEKTYPLPSPTRRVAETCREVVSNSRYVIHASRVRVFSIRHRIVLKVGLSAVWSYLAVRPTGSPGRFDRTMFERGRSILRCWFRSQVPGLPVYIGSPWGTCHLLPPTYIWALGTLVPYRDIPRVIHVYSGMIHGLHISRGMRFVCSMQRRLIATSASAIPRVSYFLFKEPVSCLILRKFHRFAPRTAIERVDRALAVRR